MKVTEIPREHTIPWLLEKHYAKRIPSISWAFGLYKDGAMIGVVTYGTPASSTLLKGVCGEEHSDKVIELNRLVINDDSPKNSASYLVSKSVKLLPPPKIIVSYADTSQGHVGYVYQATNFIYTGLSSKFIDPKVKGLEHQHHATYAHGMNNEQLKEKYGDDLYFIERPRKHRYVYFHRCKGLEKELNYAIEPYPKGDTKRYDSGRVLATQQTIL